MEQEYNPGGLVPPAPTAGRFTGPVVFVPLGYGPAVASRVARLALLRGVEAVEAYASGAAPGSTPRGTDLRPPATD